MTEQSPFVPTAHTLFTFITCATKAITKRAEHLAIVNKSMAKFCPILNQRVVYLTCLECKDRACKQMVNTKNKERKGERKQLSPKKEKHDENTV